MADETNLEVRLKRRPGGVPVAEDFDVVEAPVPVPGAGEMLCRARYLSLDPYMRGQISGRHLSGAIAVGDLMRGEVISDVVTSNAGRFDVGDRIAFRGHWQSWQVTDGAEARLVDPAIDPPSLALGILGMPPGSRLTPASSISPSRKRARWSWSPPPPGPSAPWSARLPGSRIAGSSASREARKNAAG